MKIMVHFGTSKTGSTSIQTALAASREQLAAKGVLYPDYGYNHHILSALYKNENEISLRIRSKYNGYESMIKKAESAFCKLKDDAKKPGARLAILSSETFFAFREHDAMEKLVERLREISDDLAACIYIREPASRFLSAYQQGVKRELYARKPEAMNVRPNLERINKAFGDRLTIRPFAHELMTGGDVVADFETHFLSGFGVHLNTPTKTNETLSAEVLDLLYWYKKILLPGKSKTPAREFMEFKKILMDVETELGGGTRPKLRPDLRSAIVTASTDLIWLRNEHGIEYPDIDYSTIDGKFSPNLEVEWLPNEVMTIDAEKRNELMIRTFARLQALKSPLSESLLSKLMWFKGTVRVT